MTALQRGAHGLELASSLAARASQGLIVVLAVAMVASLLLQVVFRYLIGQALSWSDEVALLSFIWIIFLAGSLGVRDAFHVRLTLGIGWLPDRWQLWLERAVLLAIMSFGAILLDHGGRYVAMTAGSVSPAMGYPIELVHLAAPVGGTLIVLHALARLPFGLRPRGGATIGHLA